ncbi:MAG: PAS domain S-box protein, partial [Gemmatimonadetes bacterium]|nr:PAS domain S-box protein [Gemmatimonadota bacterium]
MKPAQPGPIVDDANPRFIRRMEPVASGAAVVAVAGGLAVLLGWWLDIEVLKSLLHPGRIAMNPLTAVAFVLAGASLWLLRGEQVPEGRRRVGMGLGLAVVGLALLVLPRFALGLDPGVDRLLFRSRLGTNVMAPNTASTFLLVGLALSLLQTRIRRFWPSQLLILVALGLTLFSLTGYLFGVRALYGVASYIPMALNTALVFLSLCIGILAARPEREPVAIALSPTAGGALVRRLLPAALVIPLFLGMLHLRGQRAGLYEPEFGLSIFALATIILFNLLIWWYAAVIRRTDQERRQAVKAVRESEARTRLIIDTAHDAFIAMDAAGVITDWNRQAEATFGWTRSAAIGRIVADTIIPQQFREAHAQGLEHFLRTGEGPFLNHRIEISGLHLDGREFPVEMTITPIERADGWIFSAFVHDISERKEAERQLQEKNRLLEDATHAKSDFLANMSHEIRTPMNGVIGMTELLLNTELSDQQREYATLVEQSSEALLRLLNDILDFSKIEAGKLELESIPFSLRESLGDTMQALAVRAAEKDLELLYHIPAEMPDRLIGDPGRLRQIVVNLAGNAIKFTERGEVVATVSTEAATG